ncbi:hypothetical protein K501DRAFT_73167 [Backusella circina FSU 941]|nr:hypothetical protein K501DRAFT_73167 [Backusella circina FSU 941]
MYIPLFVIFIALRISTKQQPPTSKPIDMFFPSIQDQGFLLTYFFTLCPFSITISSTLCSFMNMVSPISL